MKKSRKQNSRNSYQALEPRKMLAGDVTATVNDGLLQIIGDAEGNEIIVAGRPDGTATVFAIGDTTINGSADPFVVSTSLDDVDVQLNAGDDNATIQGLVLSQSLRVRTNVGDDTTFVHHIDVQRFEQFSGDGNDTLEFNNVYSRGSILISGENNDDIVSITNMAAGTNATLQTGNGVDTIAIDNLGVKDNINLNTGGGNDQVIMTGLVYGYRANLLLEQGNDSLNILPATSSETALFLRELNIQGGDGDDSISMDASVTSQRKTTVVGGDGTDSIQQDGARLRNESISSIENQQVDNLNALLDSVYAALTAADIDTEPFGESVIVDPLESFGPFITATSTALIQNENDGPQALDDGLTLFGDDTTFTGATVSLGDSFVAGQDVLAFTDNSTTDSITGTYNATTGTLTLNGDGTSAEYQAALQAITFNNNSEAPNVTERNATFSVSRDGGDDLTATRAISLVSLNDVPVVTGATDAISVNLDDNPIRPVPLNEELTITDADGTRLSGAVVAIDEGRQTGDVLAFTDDADDGITGTLNADTGVLTFTGVADIAAYQALLRTVTFDVGVTPVTAVREISFAVTDNSGATDRTSAEATVEVNVINNQTNVEPTIAATSTTLFQSENSGPRALDDGLTLVGDDTTFTGATVSLGDTYVEGQDVLAFPSPATTDSVITGTFDSTTGALTFTGDGTAAQYQTALRAVTFNNNSEAPDVTERTATFTVSRGSGDDLTATRAISVVSFNDVPVVTGATDAISVNLDDSSSRPVPLNEELTITDADGNRLSGAVVAIDEGRQTGDVLAFTDDANDGITGTLNADTGVLTFTGVADIAAYQALLRTVTFDVGATPVTSVREISFSVSDNSGDTNRTSADATVEVDVINNQTSALRGSSGDLTVSTVGAPVAVDGGLRILPTSSAALPIFSAEVAITSGLASTQDRLTFMPVEGIEGVYDGPQGVLTFTPEDNLADAQSKFQEVLRSVSYSNIGTNTDTTDRVIQFTLVSNEDNSTSRTLNLTQPAEDRLLQDFIANADSDFPNPQKSETGLYTSIETEGTGDVATLDDRLRLTYQGTFLDGTEFDSLTNDVLQVPVSNLIEGWQEFFTEYGVGTDAKLLIPSSLGYGTSGFGSIPGDTPLIFDVELFEVIPPSTSS